MFSCGFEALESIVSVPEVVPETFGMNETLKVRLCPGSRVVGSDKPLAVNCVLEKAACEIATLVVPELVSVSLKTCEVPSGRLPKPKLAGTAES